MDFISVYHRGSDMLVQHDAEIKKDFDEIISVLKSITDKDLIDEFNLRKLKRDNIKSLSEPINHLIDQRLAKLGWTVQSPIFREIIHNKKDKTAWRLDFAKGTISVEVGYNHGEAITHNIMKPVLASELNHVEKAIQTRMGVIITATDNLKKLGGFDSAVGSFEKYKSYLRPFNAIITVPLVLIGLEAPTSFFVKHTKINKKTFGAIEII